MLPLAPIGSFKLLLPGSLAVKKLDWSKCDARFVQTPSKKLSDYWGLDLFHVVATFPYAEFKMMQKLNKIKDHLLMIHFTPQEIASVVHQVRWMFHLSTSSLALQRGHRGGYGRGQECSGGQTGGKRWLNSKYCSSGSIGGCSRGLLIGAAQTEGAAITLRPGDPTAWSEN